MQRPLEAVLGGEADRAADGDLQLHPRRQPAGGPEPVVQGLPGGGVEALRVQDVVEAGGPVGVVEVGGRQAGGGRLRGRHGVPPGVGRQGDAARLRGGRELRVQLKHQRRGDGRVLAGLDQLFGVGAGLALAGAAELVDLIERDPRADVAAAEDREPPVGRVADDDLPDGLDVVVGPAGVEERLRPREDGVAAGLADGRVDAEVLRGGGGGEQQSGEEGTHGGPFAADGTAGAAQRRARTGRRCPRPAASADLASTPGALESAHRSGAASPRRPWSPGVSTSPHDSRGAVETVVRPEGFAPAPQESAAGRYDRAFDVAGADP